MRGYYEHDYANVHRGVYALAERSTEAYDNARRQVASFFNVADPRQVIFVRNTTEAINLVAYSWGGANLGVGDVVVLSEMEHHSNIVPWQIIAERTGARSGVHARRWRRQVDPRRPGPLPGHRPGAAGRDLSRLEHAWHGQPGRRDHSARARLRGAGAA